MSNGNGGDSGALTPPSTPTTTGGVFGEQPDPTTVIPVTRAGGPGGPTGPGGPPGTGFDMPPYEPWWRRNLVALIAAGVIGVLLLIVLLVLLLTRSDDDGNITLDTSTTTESTTTLDSTTTLPETTTTVAETTTTTTLPPETTTTTTLPPATTTTTTTTVAPQTTTTSLAPAATTTTTLPVVTVPPAPQATMWDLIVNSPDLSEFRAAIETAGLIDLLDGPEPVTVFAPSNPAFDLLRAGVGGPELLADPNLMRRHLVSGLFSSADVLAATTLPTLAGDNLTIDGPNVSVDGGKLVVVDVSVNGSVLHVVDKVLTPPA